MDEDPHSSQSIGRLGQILQPWYEKDIAEGICTEEDVIELQERYLENDIACYLGDETPF